MTAVRNRATTTTDSVTVRWSATAVPTGWLVKYETPKSPLRACSSQSRYWTITGRSMPISAFFAWTVAAVAPVPRMLLTMPSKDVLRRKNVIIDTRTVSTRLVPSRRNT